jgi:hypothetical protein
LGIWLSELSQTLSTAPFRTSPSWDFFICIFAVVNWTSQFQTSAFPRTLVSTECRLQEPALHSFTMARSKAHVKGGNNGNGSNQPQGANNNKAWGAPRPNGYAHGGSVGWTSYNPDAIHPNSYSWDHFVSPSKVFCGTSVVDFTFWVQNFTMEATVAGVWDMIAPPDETEERFKVFLLKPLPP